MNKLINPNIEQLKAYAPGKPIKELERELGISDIIKLASNENPLGPSPAAIEAIKESAGQAHLYPDGGGYYLRRELSQHLGINEKQIILGNGSDEILALICHSFLRPEDEVIYAYPAFVEYELISKAFGAKRIQVPLKNFTHDLPAMAEAVTPETKLIFIANPNNPTGTMVNKSGFAGFMKRVPPEVIVVMDEAYYEFIIRDDYPDCLEYVRQKRNIIVTRTFSKAYALAGLRIGYAVAPLELINYMNRIRHPFNVNSPAQAAAVASLKDKRHLERSRRLVAEGRDYLYQRFEQMGLEYVPSVANFILIKVGNGKQVFQRLLKKGIIIRAMEVYGLSEYVRVTIGAQHENQRFIESLEHSMFTQF